MRSILVEIAGYGQTLSTRARAGERPQVLEVPSLPAARWSLLRPLPSDSTCTLRLLPSESLREFLLSRGEQIGGTRLSAPARASDTTWTCNVPPGGLPRLAWIGREQIRVVSASTYPSGHVYAGLTELVVERAQGGTIAQDYSLPSWSAAQGPTLRTAPISACDLPVTVSLRDDVTGTVRVVYRGAIAEVLDSGDAIQLTCASPIRAMTRHQWPEIPALHPWAQSFFDSFPVVGPDIRVRPGGPTTRNAKWDPNSGTSDSTRMRSGRVQARVSPSDPWGTYLYLGASGSGPAYGPPALLSTGRVAPGRVPDPAIEAWGVQPYLGIQRQPDDPAAWLSVTLRGPDGVVPGDGWVTDDGGSATADEYVLLALEPITDPAWTQYSLGAQMYQVNAASTDGSIGPYYRHRAPDADHRVLAGRLDGDPDGSLSVPGAYAAGRAIRTPILRTTAGGVVQPSDVVSGDVGTYWLAQVQGRWDTSQGGDWARLVDGASLYAALLAVTAACVTAGAVDTAASAAVALSACVAVRRPGTSQLATAWLPECWHGRTIGDTLFGDLYTQCAISWAPGPGGTLRAVWLGGDFSTASVQIGPRDVRDRDHTLDWSFDAPLSRVTVSGLRPWVTAVGGEADDDSSQSDRLATPATIQVIADDAAEEGGSGSEISLSASPYHTRDCLPSLRADPWSPPDALHRIIRECWSRAVQTFGRASPQVTLRVRGDLDAWPGTVVSITLPNIPNRHGGLGVVGMRGLVLERGDRLVDDTAEVLIQLIGWND